MRRLQVVVFVLVLLVAAGVGGSSMLRETRLNRVNATYKSCAANLRVLEGAVELYFMDHEDVEKSVESVNDLINKRMDELIHGKYLRESLQDTVQGYFNELPIPEDALPVCHITAVSFICEICGSKSVQRGAMSPQPFLPLCFPISRCCNVFC